MLDFLKLPIENYSNEGFTFPVWIYVSQYGEHVGLFFDQDESDDQDEQSSNRVTKIFHFFGKIECKDIKPSSSTKKFIAAKIKLNAVTAIDVASYLSVVSKKEHQLKYGLNLSSSIGTFDANGDVVKEGEHTCATFVAAIFEGRGFPIFDFQTWPKSAAEDLAWRDKLVKYYEELLKAQGAQASIGQVEIDAMKALNPVMRLSPTQVAGVMATPFTKKSKFSHGDASSFAVEVLSAFISAHGVDPKKVI